MLMVIRSGRVSLNISSEMVSSYLHTVRMFESLSAHRIIITVLCLLSVTQEPLFMPTEILQASLLYLRIP